MCGNHLFAESAGKIVLSAGEKLVSFFVSVKKEAKSFEEGSLFVFHGEMALRGIKLYKCGYLSRAAASCT